MDGQRIRDYWSREVDALLATYRQFETLIPSDRGVGAAHRGEDGRYVEALVRSYLGLYLPKELEILTGFIMRPAVKTGKNGTERKHESDSHSSQLDIIVYNSSAYPVFQRFEGSAIVPPEGVVAVLSVKKHLRDGDVANECRALKEAARLCRCLDKKGEPARGPFLALIAASSKIEKVRTEPKDWIFERMREAYTEEPLPKFDDVVGYIGSLDGWGIFKGRPATTKPTKPAPYYWFEHREDEAHLGLQFLLTGILSVYYDPTRNHRRRPGFTAFERAHDCKLGDIEVTGLR